MSSNLESWFPDCLTEKTVRAATKSSEAQSSMRQRTVGGVLSSRILQVDVIVSDPTHRPGMPVMMRCSS